MLAVRPVFERREEAVVEGDLDFADCIDVMVLEAGHAGEETVRGAGIGWACVGDGCGHCEDGDGDSDEESGQVLLALQKETKQQDRVKLDRRGDAEEDSCNDAEAASIGEKPEHDDDPENDFDVGALNEKDEWEGEEKQRQEELCCAASAQEVERGDECSDDGDRCEDQIGGSCVGCFIERFVDRSGAGRIGEGRRGARGEELCRVVQGEAAFVDDDVFKSWAGREENGVARRKWKQPEERGGHRKEEDESNEPAWCCPGGGHDEIGSARGVHQECG